MELSGSLWSLRLVGLLALLALAEGAAGQRGEGLADIQAQLASLQAELEAAKAQAEAPPRASPEAEEAAEALGRQPRMPVIDFKKRMPQIDFKKRMPVIDFKKRMPVIDFKKRDQAPDDWPPVKRASWQPLKRAWQPLKRAAWQPLKRAAWQPLKRSDGPAQGTAAEPRFQLSLNDETGLQEALIETVEEHLREDLAVAEAYGLAPQTILAHLRSKAPSPDPRPDQPSA